MDDLEIVATTAEHSACLIRAGVDLSQQPLAANHGNVEQSCCFAAASNKREFTTPLPYIDIRAEELLLYNYRLYARTNIPEERVVNLHGLTVEGALAVVVIRIKAAVVEHMISDIIMKVITGWGRHHSQNKSPIKHAVEQYLSERNICSSHEQNNPGALLIHFRPACLE